MRIPKEKLQEQCQVIFPKDLDGEGLLDGGRMCEEQAEIIIPLLEHAVCLDCAALIVRELQKDLA